MSYVTRSRRRANRAVEIVDLCVSGSSGDEDNKGGINGEKKVVKAAEDEDNEEIVKLKVVEDEEEEEEMGYTWGGGCRTVVDFESDDSLGNLTVKTFLHDCYLHPKILCHKQFKFVRDFMGEATGISFQLPEGAPYQIDHEDNSICVDKGDDYLNDLKSRLIPPSTDPNDYDDDDDEDKVPPYYWATITPHFKRFDLSLMVFKWVVQPMTMLFLEMYIRFCRTKYVPPPSPPPPSKPLIRRRKRRGGRRIPIKKKVEIESPEEKAVVVEVASSSSSTSSPPNFKEDNGLDLYITEFLTVFELTRNIEIEERLQGDIEAKRVRQEENKEEPKSSKELAYLMQANKKNFNTMSSSFSSLNSSARKPNDKVTNGWTNNKYDSSLSDESSSDSSSGSSNDSDYKCRIRGLRRPYRRKVKKRVKYKSNSSGGGGGGKSSKTSIKTVAQLVIGKSSKGNGVDSESEINGETGSSVATGTGSSKISTCGSIKTIPNGLNHSPSSASASGSPSSKSSPHKIICEICRPIKMFGAWKFLFRHIDRFHGSRKREFNICICGRKVRKERFAYHQKFCAKVLENGGGGGGGN